MAFLIAGSRIAAAKLSRYLGQTEDSAWAVTTTAGIIVVDTLFDLTMVGECARAGLLRAQE